ncbi:HpcH/HpaI aldolase/citrate lyase family protein [Amycolatopsis sp. NPDC101161]|uniref:HpcH/HpaI aldolase family protein n=1 Tax=Amycolatopsis sp. NPDC101161 TaxID=3363940 RepID=UPI003810A73E
MTENIVRRRWRDHEPAFGAMLGIPAISTAHAMAGAGFDWVIIEQQHAYVTEDSIPALLHALELGGTTPFVRIGENDPIGIQRALDLGARGIVAPMVNTPEQAEMVRDNTRFPPLGARSWGAPRLHATPAAANDDVLTLVMIETPLALSNIDAILAVEGIDGAVMGPSDMALSMGADVAAGIDDPQVWQAFETIGDSAKRLGKHYGAYVFTAEVAQRMVDHGADFVLFSTDIGYVGAGAAADIEAIGRIRSRSAV